MIERVVRQWRGLRITDHENHMQGDQSEHGLPSRAKGELRPPVVGCLSFVGCFLVGLFVTVEFMDYALHDIPRTEVLEALYRDGLATEYWFTGLGISLLV